MTPQARPKVKIQPLALLKVFKPLLLFIIPVLLLIAAEYFIEERSPEVAKWVNYSAYGLMAFIGLWVAIRLIFFLREVLVLWRHDQELLRQDPLFVIETKMRARLKDVHKKVAQTNHGMYDLPFFLLLGQDRNDCKSLLEGCGLSFPKDLNKAKDDSRGEVESWHVGSEAVFLDVTPLRHEGYRQHFKKMLEVLATDRPQGPINGVLVVIPAHEFLLGNLKSGTEYTETLQKDLQLMQERLQLKFPVYLMVPGIDQISGFDEFFKGSFYDSQGQIFGWSNSVSYSEPLDLGKLSIDIEQMIDTLESTMQKKLADEQKLQSVDRLYNFYSRTRELLQLTEETIRRIFSPDNYLDPVPFRGFYYTGGAFLSMPQVPKGPISSGTVAGDGSNMAGTAPTMLGAGENLMEPGVSYNWFSRDFFVKKLILEAGNISRPKRVVKKQKFLRYATIAIISLEILMGIALIVIEAGDTADWREDSGRVMTRAQILLDKPTVSVADEIEARHVLEDILRVQENLKNENLFRGATSFGLDDDLYENLAATHVAVFERYFLRKLIKEVEKDISFWDGSERDFLAFGSKLVEYIRLGNPYYTGVLSIAPFFEPNLDLEGSKRRDFFLRHFNANKSATKPVLVDKHVVSRIAKAFVHINGSSRITLPLESGASVKRNIAESEWEWWQRISRNIDNFSKGLENMLRLEAPTPGGGRDPGDQIFELTRQVEQHMNTIQEMTSLKDEGEKNYKFWPSAMPDFLDQAAAAAVGWPPVLKAVTQSQGRSAYAFQELTEPILAKDMHWIAPLLGEQNTALSKMLDSLVARQTKISEKDALLYKAIGAKVLSFITALSEYLAGMGKLIEKSGALVSTSTFYTGEELLKKLTATRDEMAELAQKEKILGDVGGQIDAIAEEVRKNDPDLASGDVITGAKEDPKAMAQKLAAGALGDVRLKRDILIKFHWSEMSPWSQTWQGSLKRERTYLASLYWMELFDWYKPVRKDQLAQNWTAMLRANSLSEGSSAFFVEDIAKFLDGWLESIPPELRAVLAAEGTIAPEMKDFSILYGQVKKFKDGYMPGLRKATNAFMGAVGQMDSAAYKSWQKIKESSEPDLSWDSLQAFSKFKEDYEINEGVALRNITGSLQEIELMVQKGFKGQLKRDFDTKWNQLIRNMKQKGCYNKFPFYKSDASAEQDPMMDIFGEAVELGVAFGILNPEDGSPMELSSESQKTIDAAIPVDRRNFILRCAMFKKFFGDSGVVPELLVKMLPGDIGRHYHWIRMYVGQTNYFDISVYGNREVKINLLTNRGGIKFVGLDVGKTAITERTITKGALGLLQLTYNYGRSVNKDRTNWRVGNQLASINSEGEQVAFEMLFTFNQTLPPLPILPK